MRPLARPRNLAMALALVVTLPDVGWAQSVALQGMLGTRALLMVNGGAPKSVAVGESHQGVKVLSTSSEAAVVDIAGQRITLRLGDSPASVGGRGTASSGRIVLTADGAGHFMGQGSINGRAMQFMVDTGASAVGLSVSDAERLGLDYKAGQPVRIGTANGTVTGWRLKLRSIRLGDVEIFEVDAVVTPQSMPFALLGNSYLTRFQMKRDNDQLTLERRY